MCVRYYESKSCWWDGWKEGAIENATCPPAHASITTHDWTLRSGYAVLMLNTCYLLDEGQRGINDDEFLVGFTDMFARNPSKSMS